LKVIQNKKNSNMNRTVKALLAAVRAIHSASAWCLLVCLPFVATAQDGKAIIDKVIATVGGEIVLLSEVEEQVSYAKSQQKEQLPPDFNCIALQNLLVQKLLVNQAKLDSVEVKDEEVENQLTARIERLLKYFNQDQVELEKYYGQSIVDIKDNMRGEMRNQLLSERMRGNITEKATITPAEVQEFFRNIPKDSLPYFNSEVEIREIVYKPAISTGEKDKARQRVEELRARLEKGEKFEDLAKKYSDDPGSGAEGGDLGWQKRGTFVAAFEAMVYRLEKNQLSPVVETEFGFHLIQLLERRGNLVHARHILIKPEITTADLNMAKAKLDTVRQMILKDSISFSLAVKRYSDKNSQSYNNDGRVANPRSGNTFFEVADLDTDIFFAIDGLTVGAITEPTQFRAPDGSRYYRLIQLQSRSKPHKADLRQDYNKIQTAALEQKKAGFTEEWVLNKLRSTYFSIDPLYDGCENLRQMEAAAAGGNQGVGLK
jgi:peptidyl-prolyl cis-trans isomerase SurA